MKTTTFSLLMLLGCLFLREATAMPLSTAIKKEHGIEVSEADAAQLRNDAGAIQELKRKQVDLERKIAAAKASRDAQAARQARKERKEIPEDQYSSTENKAADREMERINKQQQYEQTHSIRSIFRNTQAEHQKGQPRPTSKEEILQQRREERQK